MTKSLRSRDFRAGWQLSVVFVLWFATPGCGQSPAVSTSAKPAEPTSKVPAAPAEPAKPAAPTTVAVVDPTAAPAAPAADASAAPVADAKIDPLDWPMWRGPEQNGISREKGKIERWEPGGKNILWQKEELGTRSTPIIMRGKLYTLARSEPDTPREGEQVICADAKTGQILWQNKFNVYLSDVPDTRVAWSCCVGDPTTGRIYAMGVCGYLQCLDGDTGKTIWKRSLNEEFGLLTTYGGRTNVPIVHENLLIISGVVVGWGEMARPNHRYMAFDKATGEMVWFNGTRPLPDDTTYSTPIVGSLGGTIAMVAGAGDGAVWAFQPRTGLPLWQYKLSTRGVNVTPLLDNGTVYMGQSEENREGDSMGAVVAINGEAVAAGKDKDITTVGELWREKEVMVGRAAMVLVDGRLYSADDSGNFYVHDAKTGKQIGKRTKLLGTIMRSSLLYADGNIYACTVSAWHIVKPSEKGVKVTHKLRLPEGEEVHGSPVISHGRLYLPTTERMYCLELADAGAATPQAEQPAEAPIGSNTKATHAQVVPVESLVKPGEKVTYRVRLYNDHGQFVEELAGDKLAGKAKFTLEGNGEIDKNGLFTAASDAGHSAVIVKCAVGDAQGMARIRVVPPLPWKFDFSNGEVPITWVGARYRHIVREVEGNKVMVKVTTIPKGTRSQSLMGPIDLHDYTIQADVRGAIKDGKMPDMAVIGQRYTLDLMGAHQQLQVRSWTSQLGRFSKNVPYAWKPGTWYTIKLRAEREGQKATLRGKVWERGKEEPADWTLVATDEAANLQGSPGLFGNANDAEIFIDNITITPN